jgi:hypothetical protein
MFHSVPWAASVTETPQGVVLENKFIKTILLPKLGAKSVSLVKKDTGTEFCGKYGAMLDRLMISGKKGDDFENRPFEYEIVKNEAEEAVVRFHGRGKSSGYRDLYFYKTVSLAEDANSLKVRACFENKGTEAVSLTYWVTNNFQNEKNSSRYFAPAPDGIYEAWSDANNGKGQGQGVAGQDRFIYNPPRAWSGMVNPDGTGIAAVTENKYLNCLYNFLGAGGTIEWIYNSISLLPGKEWVVEYSFIPFDGFNVISGASPMAVLGIGAPSEISSGKGNAGALLVSASESFNGTLKISAMPCNGGKSVLLKEFRSDFSAGKTVDFPFDINLAGSGTFKITSELSVSGSGKSTEAFAKVQSGTPAGAFVIPSDIKKREGGEPLNSFSKAQTLALDVPEFYVADDNAPTDAPRWAKPYTRGRLNALFLLEWEQREVIELAKRLSLNYEIARTPERLQRELSRGFDVLLIGGFNWNKLPDEVRKSIAASVSNGMGLVFISGKRINENSDLIKMIKERTADTSEITDKIPLKLLDVLQKENTIVAGKIGKGRVLFIDYEERVRPFVASLVPIYRETPGGGADTFPESSREYEYAFGLLIKSVLWVADKMPLEKISFEKLPVRDGNLTRFPVAYFNPSGNTYPWSTELRIRDSFNGIVHIDKHNIYLEPGKNVDDFIIPQLPDGSYGAEVILYDNWGRSVDFGIDSFDVSSPVQMTAIETDNPSYKSGEDIECKMKIDSKEKMEAKIRVSLEDIYGWQLALSEKDLSLSPGENIISLKLPSGRTVNRTHFLVGDLFRDGKSLSRRKGKIIIQSPFEDDFLLTSYSAPVKPSIELGMNCVFDRFETAAEFDLPYVPWYSPRTMAVGFGGGQKNLTKNFIDWADLKDRNKIADGVKKRTTEVEVKYRPPAGMLIDEFRPDSETLAEAASSFEGHKKHFRKFLEGIYGTIGKLNLQWGTSYKGFDEISPWPREKVSARIQEFWKNGHLDLSPSFDHKAYWEFLIADYIDFLNKTMRSIYPDARLGLSGCNGSVENICFDYWRLAGENKCRSFGMYSGYLRNVAGSFKNKDGKIYYWSGYDRTVSGEKKLRMDLWQNLFENGDGIFYYAAKRYSPVLSPDWRPYPSGEWIKEESDVIVKGGVANLIKTSERMNDGIAILYSPRSLHAARLSDTIGETSGEKLYSGEQASMLAVLKDIGFQPSYLSYAQVERGDLSTGKYKVLVLAYSQALSDKEADAINKYVKSGGTVISTIKPGVYDEHGKLRANPCLDEIFGVKQKNIPTYETVAISPDNKKELGDFTFDVVQGDPKMPLTTGKALAFFSGEKSSACCIVNDFGKGKGILLNFSTSDYRKSAAGGVGGEIEMVKKAKSEIAEGMRGFYRSLFAYIGLKPQITVTSTKDEIPLVLDIIRFQNNDTILVGILSGMDRKLILKSDIYTARVNLPGDYFVYDVIAGKFLGRCRTFEDEITDGRPKLYALLKEPISDIALSFTPVGTQHDAIEIKVDILSKISSSARISVKTPSGKTYLDKAIGVKYGSAKLGFAFPLNAESGVWTVEAQDVISKKKDCMAVKIINGKIK